MFAHGSRGDRAVATALSGCSQGERADYSLITPCRRTRANLRAVLASDQQNEVIAAGELIVRPAQWTATARGRVLTLSAREFGLLCVFVREPGRVIRREDLYERVWDGAMRSADRSVDVYVHKLRNKLAEALPEWSFIHTHFGLGYRWTPERSQLFNNSATPS
jgi:DNA-binding response OmpR family regulator